MRILYGIQGTGNGHLARARALVPALRNAGIDLDFLLTGRAREDYFNMEVFGDFDCYEGFSLITDRGQLKTWQTITKNNLWHFFRDIRKLDLSQYDLVISDFEPLTAWAARNQKVPCLGISHQSAFDYDVPKVRGFLSSQLLIKAVAPAPIRVGLHWHHFNQPILPPLIEPMRPRQIVGDKIVVYMGFEATDDVVEFVKPFKDYRFLVYSKVREEQHFDHVHVKPLSHSAFHRDLLDCFGVISNAGFELSSECLALGKKLLIKPLLGQFEQLSNALALQALNRATIIESLDQSTLEQWLGQPCLETIQYPDVAKAIAEWIADGRQESVAELADTLWTRFDFPFAYDERFGKTLIPGMVS